MSYAASIHSHGYNQPVTPEVLHGMSREQGWILGPIVSSASSQFETEAQLVMDRLVREYLTRGG